MLAWYSKRRNGYEPRERYSRLLVSGLRQSSKLHSATQGTVRDTAWGGEDVPSTLLKCSQLLAVCLPAGFPGLAFYTDPHSAGAAGISGTGGETPCSGVLAILALGNISETQPWGRELE